MPDPITAIATAANAAKKAMEAARRLRDADLSLATAELMEALATARSEVSDLKEELRQANERIRDLTAGPRCPRCHRGTWTLAESRPAPKPWGTMGVKEHVYRCSECEFEDVRQINPGKG